MEQKDISVAIPPPSQTEDVKSQDGTLESQLLDGRKLWNDKILEIVFFIFGLSSLIGWSSFITNSLFFQKLLINTPNLYRNFQSSLAVVSMLPLLIGNVANILYFYRYDTFYLVIISKYVLLFGFSSTIVVLSVNLTDGQLFALLMILTFILNIVSPFLMSGLVIDSSYFTRNVQELYFAGQSSGGVVIASISLFSIASSLHPYYVSILFFSVTLLIVMVSTVLYLMVAKSLNYKVNKKKFLRKGQQSDVQFTSFKQKLHSYWSFFKLKYTDCLGMYFTLTITLFMWPKMPGNLRSIQQNTKWAENYFITFCVFLMFGLGDFIGRFTQQYLKWPRYGTWWTLIIPMLRVLFIPLYLICYKKSPNPKIPNLLKLDMFPCLINFLVGLTNGHMISLLFGTPYTLGDPILINDGSNLMLGLLGGGLLSGAFFSFAYK